ncbi:copper amine oxidase N-terminal domain-containing protein [Paenibacillus lautus]|uniref:copper amine oxidase N-terminal domain-containing protein n=1 Tax=Paenibacillus lautus TaxID=1401 RepID=UPI001C7D17DD|nr:copper amine oxidase N-terminal domain-containing protein [Paenibacillus lautus]MBX4145811.1 copper amine oxidase N-terminal domain-containing protein [Paenibacillus lautus]
MVKRERTKSSRRLRQMTAGTLSALMLFTSLSLPVWGDDVVPEKRILTVQSGSSSASVNGTSYTIAKPQLKQGVLMVPLGVFKKAFGSEIKLEGENRVRLLQGPHTVVLVIDNKTAWIDGKKVQLPAEPTMVSGTLMVPLRPVAAGIGAKVSSSQGKLSISLMVTDKEEKHDEGEINNTTGKTRIGNSYYEWSMNYPSWMIVGRGTDDESGAAFNDATGRYYLEVHASSQKVKLSPDDLLERLLKELSDSGDVVLHQETVASGAVPYARVISRDIDGVLWEGRQYYANDRVYELYFADAEAVHYKDMDKHASLLGSFRTTYQAGDKSLKDVSSIVGGLREAGNEEYGIWFGIPAGWEINNKDMLYGSEGEGYLSVSVTSVPTGGDGTLAAWGQRLKDWLSESFVQDSYEYVGLTPVEISGVKGQIQEVRYNFGDKWVTEYEVMIQKNGYRYYLEYAVPDGQEKTAANWKKVLESIEIDYDVVPENFGRIGEEGYLTDKTKMRSKNSETYRYHIDIPKYWEPLNDQFEQGTVEYGFAGGGFEINAQKDTSADFIVSNLKRYYNEASTASGTTVKLLGVDNITFAGVPAVSFKVHQVKNGVGFTTQEIVFESGNIAYTITTTLNDANATDMQQAALERALSSFELVK